MIIIMREQFSCHIPLSSIPVKEGVGDKMPVIFVSRHVIFGVNHN